MANKFTKSVLERQAKEQKHAPSAGGNLPVLPEQEIAAIPLPPRQPELSSIPTAQPVPNLAEAEDISIEQPAPDAPPEIPDLLSALTALPDLEQYVIRPKERSAKNKTFYLDTAVLEGLRSAAAAQHVTESKLVNDILKRLLKL